MPCAQYPARGRELHAATCTAMACYMWFKSTCSQITHESRGCMSEPAASIIWRGSACTHGRSRCSTLGCPGPRSRSRPSTRHVLQPVPPCTFKGHPAGRQAQQRTMAARTGDNWLGPLRLGAALLLVACMSATGEHSRRCGHRTHRRSPACSHSCIGPLSLLPRPKLCSPGGNGALVSGGWVPHVPTAAGMQPGRARCHRRPPAGGRWLWRGRTLVRRQRSQEGSVLLRGSA